jgi:hypothetical protein
MTVLMSQITVTDLYYYRLDQIAPEGVLAECLPARVAGAYSLPNDYVGTELRQPTTTRPIAY